MADAWLSNATPPAPPTTVDRAQLPLGVMQFVMRAFKTTVPTGYVYWTVINAPDASAALAPYSAGDLNDVVIASVFDPDA